MKGQRRGRYQRKFKRIGIGSKVGVQNSSNGSAGFPRRGFLADPETEDQIQRREVLAQALTGNRTALAELRALRLIRWERGGKVVIEDTALALNEK